MLSEDLKGTGHIRGGAEGGPCQAGRHLAEGEVQQHRVKGSRQPAGVLEGWRLVLGQMGGRMGRRQLAPLGVQHFLERGEGSGHPPASSSASRGTGGAPSLAMPWALFQKGEVECSFTPCPELDCPREDRWLGPGQCCFTCREPTPTTGEVQPGRQGGRRAGVARGSEASAAKTGSV